MNKNILTIGIICLFVLSTVSPIVFGFNRATVKESLVVTDNFDRYMYPEFYDCYSVDEIPDYVEKPVMYEYQDNEVIESQDVAIEEPTQSLGDPMDSPWPMYCHDVRHTGRSPYSTVDNAGIIKWEYDTGRRIVGSPVIDDKGIIYIGAYSIYAMYPNGTLKWKYDDDDSYIRICSAPAIDENGILYVGSEGVYPTNYLFAIYTSNGTLKWKFEPDGPVYDNSIYSSPAIGSDGSIYFGSEDDYIYALYPNGTLKWKYLTSVAVLSSPAIGNDGTVYCGSHDNHLYAFYPNNGTLKWKYETGFWIRTAPCIADDGTIYVVSLDGFLHAVNPDGSFKWKTDVGAGTSPTIGQDGTIYCGFYDLYAVNPLDGSVKWTVKAGPRGGIRGGTPCTSKDGTIFFGTDIHDEYMYGGDLIAVNPDGSERWRHRIANGYIESAPAIGEDGTIYIGQTSTYPDNGKGVTDHGYIMAINELNPDAPLQPEINGPTKGKQWVEYNYTFMATSPVGKDLYYFIDWGNHKTSWWIGPYASGEKITLKHYWNSWGVTFTIRVKVKDVDGFYSPMGMFDVRITRKNKPIESNSLFYQFLEQFPLLQKILLLIN